MLNKKIMILAILLVSLLAVSVVSAADNVTSDVVYVDETSGDVVKGTTDEIVFIEDNCTTEVDFDLLNDKSYEIDNNTINFNVKELNTPYYDNDYYIIDYTDGKKTKEISFKWKNTYQYSYNLNLTANSNYNYTFYGHYHVVGHLNGQPWTYGLYTQSNLVLQGSFKTDDYGNIIDFVHDQHLKIVLSNYNNSCTIKSMSKPSIDHFNLNGVTFGLSIGKKLLMGNNIIDEYYIGNNYDENYVKKVFNIFVHDNSNKKTFRELATKINSGESEIVLDCDYRYNASVDSDYQSGVTISSSSIVIDGKGHIIDGNCESKLLVVTGRNITLKNIVFTNSFSSSSQMDGAVFFSGSEGVIQNCSFVNISAKYGTSALSGCYNSTVTDCYFANNYARSYGHTVTLSGKSTITNCIFVNNTSEYYGGAISLTNDGNSTIRNCIFVNNTAEGGGAIHSGSGLNNIINCSFLNNHAKSWGGAMWIVGDEVNIIECYYFNNTAPSGSAIRWYGVDGVITNSSFINNIADSHGEAIKWTGKYGKMITCNFKNNVPNSYSGDITIIKKQIFINMSNHSFYYNQPINLSMISNNVSFNSKVILNFFNGNVTKIFDLFLNNNTISLSNVFNELNVGVWNMTVIFEGDDNYYPCNSTTTITVLPPSSSLTIDDVSTTVGHEVTLVANVNSTLTVNEGVVTFFDGEINIGESNVYDGVATLTYIPTTAGIHPIRVVYSSENYLSSNSVAKLLVDSVDINIDVENITYGYNSTFTVNVKGLFSEIDDGNVSFYIDNEFIGIASVVGGYAKLIYAPKVVGTYIVKAIYESDKFLKTENTTSFTVNKAESSIFIDGESSGTIEDVFLITVKANDSNGLINEGIVTFYDCDEEIGSVYVKNGIALMYYVPTTVGEHKITTIFNSNNYLSSNNTSKITVNKANSQIVFNDVSPVYYTKPITFIVNVLSDKNAIHEGNLKFYINGVKIEQQSVTTGVNTLTYLSPNVGTFDVLVVFDETDKYLTSNTSYTFTVNKLPTTIEATAVTTVYNSDKYLIVTLKDINNNSLCGFEVSIDLDGVKNLTTDENGHAKVPTNGLTPKDYEVAITFAGNENYTESNATTTVVINKDSTKLAASAVATVYNVNKDLIISLKDGQGKALEGVKVSVNLNGAKPYVTDQNGQIKVPIKGLAPKTYTAKITFNGNAKYIQATKSVKVTVKKATPKLTAKAKTFKKSVKTKKYTVTLKTNQNKVMKNIKLTLKVNGKTYAAKTNAKGQATFKITKLTKKGTFKATITYKGSAYYNKVTKKVNIKCK